MHRLANCCFRARLSATAVVFVLTVAVMALADESSAPAERIAAIRKQVADAERIFREAWAKLPDPNEEDPAVAKLFEDFDHKQLDGFDEAFKIASADPTSRAAFDSLEWLLMTPRAYDIPSFKPALGLLSKYHCGNPKIGKAIAILAYYPPEGEDSAEREAVVLLKSVAEKNSDAIVRGQAALGLAWLAKRKFTWAELEGRVDADDLALQAEKAFEEVIREYGNCPNLRTLGARPATATLKEEAASELNELRHLRIGKEAPEIDGEDLTGAKFKLSDCRGKVVVLVFWASWCGPCMAAVPHERQLVARFQNRPFSLIGVNGDEEKESALDAVEKYQISWRSFWNGKDGAGGPIAVDWNVRGWPKTYLIDHQGVIRHKYLQGERLDQPLENLVIAAEKAKASRN